MPENVIINFSTGVKMIRRQHKFRPCVAEKQHIEMLLVGNFASSKKHLVMKQFVLNVVLLKK